MKHGGYITKQSRVRRGVALLLALVMMLGTMLACEDEPVVQSDLRFVSSDGYSIYTLVYSEEHATEEVIAAVKELRDALEVVLGCEVAMSDDHVSKGMDYTYEILVGDVDRTIIPTIQDTLAPNEFTVRVQEHKIVLLGADNRATLSAIEHFMQEIMGCSSVSTAEHDPTLTIQPGYLYVGTRRHSDTPALKTDTVMPVAKYLPTELLLVDVPTQSCDAMTLATLQGLVANLSGEQILLNTESAQRDLPLLSAALPDGYDVTIYKTDADGNVWTLPQLLSYFAPKLKGYILCGPDLSSESASVAVSLAHQLQAIVVSEQNRALAEQAGLSCVFDATTATLSWLYNSDYFANISRTVAVEQSVELAPSLIDYAVMTGALMTCYTGNDAYMHAQMFRYLDDGALVLGRSTSIDELRIIQTLSAVNACYLPCSQLSNLSTLSGFAKDGVSLASIQPDVTSTMGESETGKHTVCILMSGGEDLSWLSDDFLTSTSYFGSDKRGLFAMSWGVPATIGELYHPLLTSLASARKSTDAFVVQFSGIGAAFPSLWRDDALSEMAQKLGQMMDALGVSYLQVTDAAAVSIDKLQSLASLEVVQGIFYSRYPHESTDATIAWVGETPMIPVRYFLSAGENMNGLEYIAESINTASTNAAYAQAYSVIVVDAASGLDAQGHLIEGGNTMDAVAALVAALDENVEVVGADAFVARIKANLAPTLQNGDNSGK